MRIEKVLLINLPEEGQCADFYTPKYAIDSFSVYPPLGLLYVATAIKDSYAVEIVDVVALHYTIEETVREIIHRSPSVLGISLQTFRLYPMAEIVKRVKAKLSHTVVVVGGPHTTLYPVETLNLPGVDYVITGDGEMPFKALLDALSNDAIDDLKNIAGLVFRTEQNTIERNPPEYGLLDNIKIPDRSLLDYRYYYTAADEQEQVVTMISSRGCPFQCIFCDVQEKRYRWRSARNVVDEMENISKSYSSPLIHIFDDTFNLSKKRVVEICDELRRRKLTVNWTTRARVSPCDEEMVAAMKDAGLKRVHLGVESGSVITLENIKKGIKKEQIIKAFELYRKYDIDILAYFIIGFDWETKKDINDTIGFIKKIKPTYTMANTLYPAAKTVIYDDLMKQGKITKDFWQEFAENPVKDFRLPQYRNLKTQRYLKRKLDEIYLTFYLSPTFVFKNLSEKKKKGGTSVTAFFFKVKLAVLIVASYVTNYLAEITEMRGGKNEVA